MQCWGSIPHPIKKETSRKWTGWTKLPKCSRRQLRKDLGKGHLKDDGGENDVNYGGDCPSSQQMEGGVGSEAAEGDGQNTDALLPQGGHCSSFLATLSLFFFI